MGKMENTISSVATIGTPAVKLGYVAELNAIFTNSAASRQIIVDIAMRSISKMRAAGFTYEVINGSIHYYNETHTHTHVFNSFKTCFGKLINKYDYHQNISPDEFDYHLRNVMKWTRDRSQFIGTNRCGVEVVGMRPNAKGSTYSNQCKLTVPQLKEKCKANGIKTTKLKKTELLAALMKV